ncbi:Ccl1 protein [Candida orthopsilosis Co 90-125]|uniref:Ccl1 protein n=1 Tax=Candida orthopsilosis (strain 90-125) TaxID=1136231 RepID=H8X1V3_CANO9|nr:Ccl1 protein [Candida orthopsilosis Co 90-125]CCG22509.1 Ccl1 protein [Candida orthopsilosis Co 90-125]
MQLSTESENMISKKQRISNDDLYRNSTQYGIWSFTQDELAKAKANANQSGVIAARERFQKAYNKAKNENPDSFEKFPQELNEDMISLLTLEEESTYLEFYIQNITTTCNFFKMPTQVRLTAASFFKKFYLVNSVMHYHPKNILYTCIFLAAKSENYFISIESYVKALKGVQTKDILDLEFIVLQSLKFTLLVHHPFRPLYGFFLDFQAILLNPSPVMYDVSADTIGNLYNKAKEWLNKYYMLSDVAFLFTPPQIALAAMYDCDRRISDRYLKRKFLKDDKEDENTGVQDSVQQKRKQDQVETHNTTKKVETEQPETENGSLSKHTSKREQYESLVRTIRKCAKLAKDLPVADREKSKEIDKKCFFALNPGKLIDKRIKRLTTEKAS